MATQQKNRCSGSRLEFLNKLSHKKIARETPKNYCLGSLGNHYRVDKNRANFLVASWPADVLI